MSDKVRGALFAMLGDIEGLRVLDAFAGSGALSFEAVSRGAAQATVIEINKPAQRTITANIQALGVQAQIKLIKASANAWLRTTGDQFDIVLCDPPYDDLQPNLLARLSERVVPKGLLVLSWPGKIEPPEFSALQEVTRRSYGDIQLIFYHR